MFAATYLTYAICLAIHICMPQTFYAIALAPMGPAESALRYASLLAWVALGVVTWFGGDEDAPEPDRLEGVPGKDDLSDRERLIVQGLLDGKTLADLARGLGISPSTVATYRRRALDKLGAIAVQGILLGGPGFPWQPLILGGGFYMNLSFLTLVATVTYPVAIAWLAVRLLVPASVLEEPEPSGRERAVLYLRGRGLRELEAEALLRIALDEPGSRICKELSIAPGTVNAYRAHAYALLGVHSKRELAALLEHEAGLPGRGAPPSPDDGGRAAL